MVVVVAVGPVELGHLYLALCFVDAADEQHHELVPGDALELGHDGILLEWFLHQLCHHLVYWHSNICLCASRKTTWRRRSLLSSLCTSTCSNRRRRSSNPCSGREAGMKQRDRQNETQYSVCFHKCNRGSRGEYNVSQDPWLRCNCIGPNATPNSSQCVT